MSGATLRTFIFVVGIWAWPAIGAESAGLQFSADLQSIRVEAEPGAVVNRNFRLALPEDQRPVTFRAKTEDWWPSEDGTRSFYREAGTLKRSCGQWVSLNPVESLVHPGETLTIRLSVAVPDFVEPGGYWCVLTVDEVPEPASAREGIEVRFLGSVSVGVFVYVEPVDRAARITGVRISDTDAQVLLLNEGNTPLGVEGRVEFYRPGTDEVVAQAAINRRTVVLEPTRSIVLKTELPPRETLPSDRYLVRVILDIGLDAFLGVEKELEIRREASPLGTR